MPEVVLRLHQFDSEGDANQTAEDIRARGGITYVNAEGSEVSVTVGDVTVELWPLTRDGSHGCYLQ